MLMKAQLETCSARKRPSPLVGLYRVLALTFFLASHTAMPVIADTAVESTSQRIFIVAHRGAASVAPENTLPAHDAAIRLGANMVELDVRYTRDGHFVVIHDSRVNRTTDGTGRVSRMTLAEIKQLDAGSWKGEEFAGTRIPTLREALRNLKGRAGIDIDFKSGPRNSGELIAQILEEEGFDEGPLVTVFARPGDYKRLQNGRGVFLLRPHYSNEENTRLLAREQGIKVMGLRYMEFTYEKARLIREENMALFTNAMGEADGPRAYGEGVRAGASFIQTNRITRLVGFLQERDLLKGCIPSRNFDCWESSGEVLVASIDAD